MILLSPSQKKKLLHLSKFSLYFLILLLCSAQQVTSLTTTTRTRITGPSLSLKNNKMISRKSLQSASLMSSARRSLMHQQRRQHHILFSQTASILSTENNTKQTFSTTPSTTTPSSQTDKRIKYKNKAYIGIGSNLGNRIQHMNTALSLLTSNNTSNTPISITKTSHLHETQPMYVLNQPTFLNGVIEISTDLQPMQLLDTLKYIEETCGREMKSGIRYGPRVIDLDILLYYQRYQDQEKEKAIIVNESNLTIPHPLMNEREFVLKPLCDLNSTLRHPLSNTTMFQTLQTLYEKNKQEAVRVLPLLNNRLLAFNKTLIMGILNVTPDSFSDGGKFYNDHEDKKEEHVKKAIEEAVYMVEECGVDVIDVGGESTRPGSKEVRVDEEMKKVLPVIDGIREVSDIPISIDTRHSTVAQAAIKAGADIINDISGGTFDPQMLPIASSLNVPIILMHSRGTPETMQQLTSYNDVVQDVASELWQRVDDAESHGIYRWNIMLDPGIGFAKDLDGNLSLLKNGSGRLRELLHDASMLWGPSRKRFIGTITGEENAEERDYGTVGACITAICGGNSGDDDDNGERKAEWRQGGGCNMLRVHNVKAVKQAVMVMDAIHKAK